jgi:hypothetical protein
MSNMKREKKPSVVRMSQQATSIMDWNTYDNVIDHSLLDRFCRKHNRTNSISRRFFVVAFVATVLPTKYVEQCR